MKNEIKKNKKVEFFEEEASLQKSSCSLWSIFIVLFAIFILFLLLVVYLKTKDIFNFNYKGISQSNSQNINNKFTEISSKTSGETVSITITEADLNSAIISQKDLPLKKPKIKIYSDKLLISGKTSDNILSLSVDVYVVPKITDGKIDFTISEIKTGGVIAPKKISDQINSNLSGYLSGMLPAASDLNVTDLKLYNGYLK